MNPRICVVGGGTAGLSFVWHLGRLRPDLPVDLVDPLRPVAGAGVVLAPEKAAEYPEFFEPLRPTTRHWDALRIRTGDYCDWSGGHQTLGLAREALVGRLRQAVRELDTVRWRTETLRRPPDGYDLVVGADGAASRLRRHLRDAAPDTPAAAGGPPEAAGSPEAETADGELVYLWCGVRGRLPALFDVVPLAGGHLVVHGYPHAPERGTLVLEAAPEVLRDSGLAPADLRVTGPAAHGPFAALARLVTRRLGVADLRAHTGRWRRFTTVRCARWSAGRLVLIGDAAHALHFSVGSGTALALDDGRALAELVAAGDPAGFEAARRPAVEALWAESEVSRRWFERLARRHRLDGVRTAFALRARRSTNDLDYLTARDPAFVARALRALGLPATPGRLPAPRSAPLTVGGVRLPGREVATGDRPGPLPYPGAELAVPDGRRPEPRGVVVRDPAAVDALGDVDFVAVPSAPGGRVPGTELADTVRGRLDRPVLLLDAHRLDPVAVDTQLAAGAFDLHAAVSPTTLERLTPGTVLSLRPKELSP